MERDRPNDDARVPCGPTDTPLSRVVDVIDGDRAAAGPGGGDGQFTAIPGGRIRCLTCRSDLNAASVSADRATRLEGASDPGDMSFIVPITCPVCHASGSLVLRYGPEADEDDADVLLALERVPHVGAAGERPTPGIERSAIGGEPVDSPTEVRPTSPDHPSE